MPQSGERKQTMENKDEVKTVSRFEHENALWHYGNVNHRSMLMQFATCIMAILIVLIFVTAHTAREDRLLNTIDSMLATITEVMSDGVHEQQSP